MGRPFSSSSNSSPKRSMRNLIGIFKDKVSLIKATLLLSKRTSSSFHVAVIRATAHFPATEPPPEATVDDVLALGHYHRPAASAVVDTLLRRLRGTKNAYVALKCQLTLHHILSRGSPVLKDRISSSAVGPHSNYLLNLSKFRDESDADTWELSGWVRWYAGVLEQVIVSSGVLGFDFHSTLTGQYHRTLGEKVEISVRSLLREISSLVGLVEQISRSPESLHYQRISLIHEAMKLVGEDYRMAMREVLARVVEFEKRIHDSSDGELSDFCDLLKKLEGCKEKLLLMFLNKKNGDWDLIEQTRKEVEGVKERRQSLRVVRFQGTGLGSIRLGGDALGGEVRPLRPRGKRWLDVAWNPLVVPQAC